VERRKLTEADFVVTESCVLRDALAGKREDPTSTIVSHNAADPLEFYFDEGARRQERERLDVGDQILVGYIGSYAWYHAAEILVQAAALLRERLEIKFVMLGSGEGENATRRLAKELGVLGNTVLMKHSVPRKDVARFLSAIDIAVLPGSTDIICPIKVHEYMACERAVVVPDYACNREVVRDGETGLFFTPRGAESLASRICILARDQSLRCDLGERARLEVLRRFTWEHTWGSALKEISQRIEQ